MPNRGRGEPNAPDWAAPPIRKNCREYAKNCQEYASGHRQRLCKGHKSWYLAQPSSYIAEKLEGYTHGAREARLEAKASDESRTGIGSRWIVVARGRRVGGTGSESARGADRTDS